MKKSGIFGKKDRPSAEDFQYLPGLVSSYAKPLKTTSDLDPVLDHIADSRYVLLGEASHGTHEYYTWRMHLTQRLIKEKRFSFVAVEGDWPDCYRVNRYVKGYINAGNKAVDVLHSFDRWPTWMWANWEMVAFAEWLHAHNEGHTTDKKIGFYGLDVYSLHESLEYIMNYLKKNDPSALVHARKAVQCFEPFGTDGEQDYAQATTIIPHLCEDEVVNLLREIRNKMASYNSDYENVFSAEQNALIAVNAENYYHAMVRGGSESWNIRDRHMVNTLERLMDFHGPKTKAVIWEHNTHIGDARATDMFSEGMVNVGQLMNENHGNEGVVSVGFGSYQGSVMAGTYWGDVMRKMAVPPAKNATWEQILHSAGEGEDMLLITDNMKQEEIGYYHLGHRAIGVVYNPEYESYRNYVPTIIPKRYNAFMFIDESKALHPLHVIAHGGQLPETYPFGV